MQSILYSLFGSYVPVAYTTAEGVEIIPAGVAGLDIPYIAGVALFGICLWQLLSTVRGFINRG